MTELTTARLAEIEARMNRRPDTPKNAIVCCRRQEVLDLIAALRAAWARIAELERNTNPAIVGRSVVSEPGDAIHVEQLALSEEARRKLTTGVSSLPSVKKESADE